MSDPIEAPESPESEWPRHPGDCLFSGGHVWMIRTRPKVCCFCGLNRETREIEPKDSDG